MSLRNHPRMAQNVDTSKFQAGPRSKLTPLRAPPKPPFARSPGAPIASAWCVIRVGPPATSLVARLNRRTLGRFRYRSGGSVRIARHPREASQKRTWGPTGQHSYPFFGVTLLQTPSARLDPVDAETARLTSRLGYVCRGKRRLHSGEARTRSCILLGGDG